MSNKLIPATVRSSLTPVVCGLLLVCACAGGDRPDEAGAGRAEGTVVSIVPSLTVVVAGDSVRFKLRVANNGETAVLLHFSSGQRFDFAVRDAAGEDVWLWSSSQMFAQVMGEENLEAGAVLEYYATWDPGEREGPYRAVARLVSSDRPLELETEFELGGG